MRNFLGLVLVGVLLLPASIADAQCANGQCDNSVGIPVGNWAPARKPLQNVVKGVVQKAHPAICKVYAECDVTINGRSAKEMSIGSGVLVWRGTKKATVLTVQHLFSRRATRVWVIFPNGERCDAERVQAAEAPDLGMITIPSPNVQPIEIYTGTPTVGESVSLCGYDGETGQYRVKTGVVLGYGKHDGQPLRHDLIVSGTSTGGQSGGAIIHSTGKLAGIIWGTDDTSTRGTFNGALCQFLGDDQYIAPWNANLAAEKYKADAQAQAAHAQAQAQVQAAQIQAQAAQNAPVVAPNTNTGGNGVDATARQMAQNNASGLKAIDERVTATEKALGMAIGGVATKVDDLQSQVGEQEQFLGGKLKDLIKSTIFSVLTPWGIGGSILGTILFFLLRKKATVGAQFVDKVTDIIPGTWDDRILDTLAYKVASVVSGKPTPPYAHTPGMDPWGRPYPQAPQAPQPPTEPAK